MCDLDALSREIAATSDAWIVRGVEAMQDGTLLRICVIDRPGDPGVLHGMNEWGCVVRWLKGADMRPNLSDPVTVNSLLGDGEVVDYWGKGKDWIVNHTPAIYPSRTEAIARAWIAAHKGDK